MHQLIADFPAQLRQALEIGRSARIRANEKPIHKIVVAGMGGSGIGANFVQSFVREQCPASFQVEKGYDLPAWVDEHTLVLVSSYSGNTEETLSCLEQAMTTGGRIIGISSGGSLKEKAGAAGFDFVQLPEGYSSPRACLGFSLTAQLAVLEKLGLADTTNLEAVEKAAQLLEKEQADIRQKAERIAFLLQDKLPVVYTVDRMEPVAVRLRQQLNENSKMLAWHHVIPEMNHNELVGWRTEDPRLAVLFLRNRTDAPRNQVRTDINKEIISNFTGSVIELWSKGESLIERALYLVHLSDWLSLHLAEIRKMDPVEIRVIDHLKAELAKY